VALRWEAADAWYRCGAMIETRQILRDALPAWLRSLAPILVPVLRRLAGRWIAAGQGCDCSLEVVSGVPRRESERQSDA